MFRWLIVLFLALASATAWGQSASTGGAQTIFVEKSAVVRGLETKRAALAARYQTELATIDELKARKKTWNGERQLKDKLSAANETATQLKTLDVQLQTARTALIGARNNLIAAIDNELRSRPDAVRQKALEELRKSLVPTPAKPNLHRIAIPSLEVDPKADPEDLDAQASELRQLEAELDRQARMLDEQSKSLAERERMRREHDRTIALNNREDNTPTRNPAQSAESGGRTAAEDSNSSPSPTTGGDSPPPMEPGMFESEATVVLQDVIDPTTIDTLTTAQRSGDPAKRSKAAAKARDAVKSKLDLVRQKRALIEQRAKQLRK